MLTPTSLPMAEADETTPLLPRTGCRLVAALVIEPSSKTVVIAATNSDLRVLFFNVGTWKYWQIAHLSKNDH